MYINNLTQVKTLNGLTEPFISDLGVKQGDNMSPTLFKVFINNIVSMINEKNSHPAKIGCRDISCLLYADDLIVMSETAEGLQNCFDALESYSKEWLLKVNLKKTKVIVFNKRVTNSFKFLYDGGVVEIVNCYVYLGIKFSQSNSFQEAMKLQSGKATKAMFAMNQAFKHHTFTPILSVSRLFDHLVKPILTYGSEIWAWNFYGNHPVFKDIKEIEKVHLRFCKYLLGVSRTCTNEAVRAELGRYPIGSTITRNMCNYWLRLKQLDDTRLAKIAFEADKCISDTGKKCWVATLKSVFKNLNLQNNDSLTDELVQKRIEDLHDKKFKEYLFDDDREHGQKNKLRTFRKFKSCFSLEHYLLCIQNKAHRQALSKLRTSNHHLMIESGRYKQVSAELRFCPFCPSKIEDEPHFICECSHYGKLRDSLFEKVTLITVNFPEFSSEEKFLYLMSTKNDTILTELAKYVFICFCERKKALGSNN